MKNEATPRPWHISKDEEVIANQKTAIISNSGRPIALTTYIMAPSDWKLEDQANAELIVRAVNAHDAMLEALRAVEWIIANCIVSHGTADHHCPLCGVKRPEEHGSTCQLTAAITLATEEK